MIANDSQPHVSAWIVSPALEEICGGHAFFDIFQGIDCGKKGKMREDVRRTDIMERETEDGKKTHVEA